MSEDFMSKLPNDYLYATACADYRCTPCQQPDFFDFLSAVDENRRRTRDEFSYIQANRIEFCNKMKDLMGDTRSFIDVGCGAGDKLKIVHQLFPNVQVWGVEHDPTMAIWAQACNPEAIVVCRDAFDIDFNYFGFIYAYWPVANEERMNLLIEHIMATKKKDTPFYLVGYYRLKAKWKKRFQHKLLLSSAEGDHLFQPVLY